MANTADLRSIMGLPPPSHSKTLQPSTSKKQSYPQGQAGNRRPEGVSREVFALMGDNAPSLQAFNLKFKERPKVRKRAARWFVFLRFFIGVSFVLLTLRWV